MPEDPQAEFEDGLGDPETCSLKDLFPDQVEVTEYCSFQTLLEECKPLISPSIEYSPVARANKKRVVRVTARRI
jgi:hypothetical protein